MGEVETQCIADNFEDEFHELENEFSAAQNQADFHDLDGAGVFLLPVLLFLVILLSSLLFV
jgi:hypothetical protein